MRLNQYNENRFRRKKLLYRFKLGLEQMINYPIINCIWILFVIIIALILKGKTVLLSAFKAPQILATIYNWCLNFLVVFIPILLVFVFIQTLGELVARKDEANLIIAFDEKDLRNGYPMLIKKKKLKGKDIITREFYTTIPLNRWIEKKDTIADVMNIHFIGNIEYGNKNNGNKISFKSARGRKLPERELIYDEFI